MRHVSGWQVLDTTPEIRAITNMHRVSVMSGKVTTQDVYNACRGAEFDVVHFATHSDEHVVALSDGEKLDAEDIAQVARLAHVRLLFFNSCKSAKLAAFAVSHGVPYAIATTIDLPDRDAWKTALSFYEYCRVQMLEHNDPARVDIVSAFRQAVNGDGTYMLLTNIQRQSDLAALKIDFDQWKTQQDAEAHAWRHWQRAVSLYLSALATAGVMAIVLLAWILWSIIARLDAHIIQYPMNW